MKEPLIADFVERFLYQHNSSNEPSPVSRPTSVKSRHSSGSVNNANNANTQQQSRSSFRLSQAELLDYSHQHQKLSISDTNSSATPNSKTSSPITSVYLPLTPASTSGLSPKSNSSASSSSTFSNTTSARPNLPHRLSRGASMVSLDAAMISM